jgi:stage II sporulation protein D
MDAEPDFWVRVLLLNDVEQCKLQSNSSFDVISGETRWASAGHSIGGIREAHFDGRDGAVMVEGSSGKITIGGQVFRSREVTIVPSEPYILRLNGDEYRGKLKLILNADGKSLDAINLVPLEPYLAGVVGAEMPHYWEPAALQAQAIAARTYCLYIKRRFGVRRNWDVRKTQANQVYLGVRAESRRVWEAVNRTYGQVLECRHTDGSRGIFPTYYSSTCGGHTENSKYVFGDSFGPLVGVECPYCAGIAKPGVFFWPMVKFDKSTVTARLEKKYPQLKKLGGIKDIRPVGQSEHESSLGKFTRLTKLKLLGSTGKIDFVRAEDFRLSVDSTGLKLKSTIFKIANWGNKWAFLSGIGFGHGVGMCQCGAEGMARQGKTARQILSHYYPGSWIDTVY